MLILPTDSQRQRDPVAAVAGMPRNWRRGPPPFAVIVRATDETFRAKLALALLPVCRARRVRLLVANDPKLAARIRADGVHLSEAAVARDATGSRAISPRSGLVTAAAHSYTALLRAHRRKVDVVLLSPVFATASHPGARPLGALRFAAWVHALRRRGIRMPVVALGGVSGANAARLDRAGASGLAAIGALS